MRESWSSVFHPDPDVKSKRGRSHPAASSAPPPPSSAPVWAAGPTPPSAPRSPASAGPRPRRSPRTRPHRSSSAVRQDAGQTLDQLVSVKLRATD